MGEKTVKIIGFCVIIPSPIRGFVVLEHQFGFGKFVGIVAPNVIITLRTEGGRFFGALKPLVFRGRMVQNEINDDANTPLVGFFNQVFELLNRPKIGVNFEIIGNIVAVIFEGRFKKRHQRQAIDAQILQIIQFFNQPLNVARPIVVAVVKRFDI